MSFKIRVCCLATEIRTRLDSVDCHFPFSLVGDGQDYCILIEQELSDFQIEMLFELFADVFYGDGDTNLAATLVALLYEKGLFIACAESLTGGMICSALVDVAGCSEVFYEGLVTYSNISKMDRLGVGADTIVDYGAVSSEAAIEMANGLINESVSVAISTTGIAGPTGGSEEKPVGLTYISVVSENRSESFRCVFGGERNEIRKQAKRCCFI